MLKLRIDRYISRAKITRERARRSPAAAVWKCDTRVVSRLCDMYHVSMQQAIFTHAYDVFVSLDYP